MAVYHITDSTENVIMVYYHFFPLTFIVGYIFIYTLNTIICYFFHTVRYLFKDLNREKK